MKKKVFFVFGSAIALLGTVTLSACSSNDDVVDNPDYDPASKAVKTQFVISLPSNVNAAKTRQTATNVQQADNSFLGIQELTLIPFETKPTSSAATRYNAPITLGTIAATGDLTNLSSNGGTDNYKVFSDVTIPIGTSAFLVYGKKKPVNAANKSIDGETTGSSYTANTTADYTFTPERIQSDAAPAKGATIAAYLTTIAEATGWAGTTNDGLKDLYTKFTKMEAGNSFLVQRAIQDLYKSVYTNLDAVSQAIAAAIVSTNYGVTADTEGTLTWPATLSNYPRELGLPDGAAAVKWDGSSFNVADAFTPGINVANIDSYCFPAALWYRANTAIKTANRKQATETGDKYPSDRTTWDEDGTTGILNLYNGSTVTSDTRSIALVDQLQYAVGRLDVKVQCANSTLYDSKGQAVTVPTSGFPVLGVLVGNQKAVDFQFEPVGSEDYTIYDTDIPTTMSANAEGGTGYGVYNYTLVLETLAAKSASDTDNDVTIAVELENNTGMDFYGKGGQLIPAGGRFYLLATLQASQATETGMQVFKQDYYTIADLTIKLGTPDDGTTPIGPESPVINPDGLGSAYDVIPDLRTPSLELGMSVNLQWKPGHTFTQTF